MATGVTRPAGAIPVLPLWQPHATLIALLVKWLETRDWQTAYRGRIAISATARTPVEFLQWEGEGFGPHPTKEHPAWSKPIGDYRVLWEKSTVQGRTLLDRKSLVRRGDRTRIPLPNGAILCTADLVDIAPIGGPYSFRTGTVQGDEGDAPGRPVVVRHPAGACGPESLMLDMPGGPVRDVTDQLPYGDWSPGRYAWLLENVRVLASPVPFKAKQKMNAWWVPTEEAA